ncbi:MAG: prepilin-type N-terminal cleavage/methylation domain-containing protein [Gemmataceae bacterium]|nr:prepilin-type N-terminal cleavage/methylation domain-containing protein [Gemmataceae bacterium]
MKLAVTPRQRAARRAGFTLLEVLVVVAILVILAGVGVVATTRYLEDARKSKAQLACQGLVQAIGNYIDNPANTDRSPPTGPGDLLRPPFGGTGYLKNGEQDMYDPWGQQYQFEQIQQADGSQGYVVFTYAKDGTNTPISNFGIGPASRK